MSFPKNHPAVTLTRRNYRYYNIAHTPRQPPATTSNLNNLNLRVDIQRHQSVAEAIHDYDAPIMHSRCSSRLLMPMMMMMMVT